MTGNKPEWIDKWYSISSFWRSLTHGNKYTTERSSNYGKIIVCIHGYLKGYSRFASAGATADLGRACSKPRLILALLSAGLCAEVGNTL